MLTLTYSLISSSQEPCKTSNFFTILQIRKSRFRMVERFIWGHTYSKWQIQNEKKLRKGYKNYSPVKCPERRALPWNQATLWRPGTFAGKTLPTEGSPAEGEPGITTWTSSQHFCWSLADDPVSWSKTEVQVQGVPNIITQVSLPQQEGGLKGKDEIWRGKRDSGTGGGPSLAPHCIQGPQMGKKYSFAHLTMKTFLPIAPPTMGDYTHKSDDSTPS